MNKISWWVPKVGSFEMKILKKVIDNNYANQGQLTEELESKIAKILNIKHVVMTNNGTVSLFLALKALGIGVGDEVVVPDITYIATANAVTLCGAKVVLVDVTGDAMIDPVLFEERITSKTKAVIPVHISGRSAPIIEILKIAKKHNIYVVEDAAEAFCSKLGNKYLGTYGHAGAFSMSPNKIITSGQGGFVVTNDKKTYIRLRQLRNQGVEGRLSGGDDFHGTLGFNFKFTDLQAAVALGQLMRLPLRIRKMSRINNIYRKELKNLDGINLFKHNEGQLQLWTDVMVDDRAGLDDFLKKNNIDCRRFWFPLHKNPSYLKNENEFPMATKINPKCLWLPSAFSLTDRQVKKVVKFIKLYLSSTKINN